MTSTPTTPKPTPANGFTNTATLPAYVKEQGLFCLWRYTWNADKGKWDKVPYNPYRPQEFARTNDPATFASMDKAAAAGRAHGFDGIGIGVFGAVAAIDIDHCISGGELSEMAQEIIATMDAYTEISPSGEGIRILFLAPNLRYDSAVYKIHNKEKGLEIYLPGMTRKYLTVTGNVLRACDMENRESRLQAILDKYMKRSQTETQAAHPAQPLSMTDTELLEKAKNAKNGPEFDLLWAGQWQGNYKSQSEADQALCNLLAFWTGGEAARIESLFNQSGLVREKWTRRAKYREDTIKKAIASCKEFYSPKQPQKAPEQAVSAVEVNSPAPAEKPQESQQEAPARSPVELFDSFLEKIQTDAYKPVQTGMAAFDRLLRGGIPRQSLVILTAAPGTGKTTLAQQIFEAAAAQGTDVVFLNLEMSREQLLARSLSRMIHKAGGNISASDIMRGYAWTDIQRRYIEESAVKYRNEIAPHMTYNPDRCSAFLSAIMETLNKAATAAKLEGKPAPVCVLDYLHLVRAEPNQRADQQEIIKSTVAALKGWAIENNSYVFAISAANRNANSAGKQTLESARDSSGIEYTADVYLSLNYQELHSGKANAESPDDMERLQKGDKNGIRHMLVQVLKNRMTEPGGKLYLAFDAANSTFIPETQQAAPAFQAQKITKFDDPENPYL